PGAPAGNIRALSAEEQAAASLPHPGAPFQRTAFAPAATPGLPRTRPQSLWRSAQLARTMSVETSQSQSSADEDSTLDGKVQHPSARKSPTLNKHVETIANASRDKQVLYGESLLQVIERVVGVVLAGDSFHHTPSGQKRRLPFVAHQIESEISAIFNQRCEVHARGDVLFTDALKRRINHSVL